MSVSLSSDLPCQELVEQLRDQQEMLRAHGIVSLSIFGSRARGDNRWDSDLDLLVDYDRARKFSLVDLVHVEHMIERMVGIEVQITTWASVPSATRARLAADSVRVF